MTSSSLLTRCLPELTDSCELWNLRGKATESYCNVVTLMSVCMQFYQLYEIHFIFFFSILYRIIWHHSGSYKVSSHPGQAPLLHGHCKVVHSVLEEIPDGRASDALLRKWLGGVAEGKDSYGDHCNAISSFYRVSECLHSPFPCSELSVLHFARTSVHFLVCLLTVFSEALYQEGAPPTHHNSPADLTGCHRKEELGLSAGCWQWPWCWVDPQGSVII